MREVDFPALAKGRSSDCLGIEILICIFLLHKSLQQLRGATDII